MANTTKTGFNLPHPMRAVSTLMWARKQNIIREQPDATILANLRRYEELGIVEEMATLRGGGGNGGYAHYWRLTPEGKLACGRSGGREARNPERPLNLLTEPGRREASGLPHVC
jgi:hypothetical protein